MLKSLSVFLVYRIGCIQNIIKNKFSSRLTYMLVSVGFIMENLKASFIIMKLNVGYIIHIIKKNEK